ncbi:MAG: hypothetical protein G01um101419_509 [Parcubacteria group bacterium Gr01-1014_19]|nr:MAG: hypothetical protein G01um101419_509 [Parcubacteria group bacterium Gr01-1014_19]
MRNISEAVWLGSFVIYRTTNRRERRKSGRRSRIILLPRRLFPELFCAIVSEGLLRAFFVTQEGNSTQFSSSHAKGRQVPLLVGLETL